MIPEQKAPIILLEVILIPLVFYTLAPFGINLTDYLENWLIDQQHIGKEEEYTFKLLFMSLVALLIYIKDILFLSLIYSFFDFDNLIFLINLLSYGSISTQSAGNSDFTSPCSTSHNT